MNIEEYKDELKLVINNVEEAVRKSNTVYPIDVTIKRKFNPAAILNPEVTFKITLEVRKDSSSGYIELEDRERIKVIYLGEVMSTKVGV
jgi:hypothetical protein